MRKGRLKNIIDDLHSFLELLPNWDEEDAPAIDPTCVERAEKLIRRASAITHREEIAWTDPSISTTPDGGICVSFENGEKQERYIVVFVNPGEVYYELIVGRVGEPTERRQEFFQDTAKWAVWAMLG